MLVDVYKRQSLPSTSGVYFSPGLRLLIFSEIVSLILSTVEQEFKRIRKNDTNKNLLRFKNIKKI